MKHVILALSILGLGAGGALAQTRQASVGTEPTGDAIYSLRVVGQNGAVYNCKPTTEERNGVTVRECVAVEGSTLFAEPGVSPQAIAAGGAGFVILAIALDGSDASSTTTDD